MMETPHHCGLCDETFDNEDMLRRHERLNKEHLNRIKTARLNFVTPTSDSTASTSSIGGVKKPCFKIEATPKSEREDEEETENYDDLFGGRGNYLRPGGPSAAPPPPPPTPPLRIGGGHKRSSQQSRDEGGPTRDVKPPMAPPSPPGAHRLVAVNSSSDNSSHAASRLEPDSTSPTPPENMRGKLESPGELPYTPQEASLVPILNERDVKPALVACAPTRKKSRPTTTQREKENPTQRKFADDDGIFRAAADSSTCEPVKKKVAPVDAGAPTANEGDGDDDDDDVVVEGLHSGRIRGGHDSGTAFQRFEQPEQPPQYHHQQQQSPRQSPPPQPSWHPPQPSPPPPQPSPPPPQPSPPPAQHQPLDAVIVESDDDDDDDDVVLETPASSTEAAPGGLEGRHEKHFCKFCNIKLCDDKHWQRHKNTSIHLANVNALSFAYAENYDESNAEGYDGEQYYEDDDDDDQYEYQEDVWHQGQIVDPMFAHVPQKVGARIYTCSHCNVNCTGIECYHTHLNGQKHRKKMNEMKLTKHPETWATRDLEQRFMADLEEPYVGLNLIQEFKFGDNVRYNCHLCSTATLTREDLASHVKSMEHRKRFLEEFSPNSLRSTELQFRGDDKRSRLEAEVTRYREAAKKALKRMDSFQDGGFIPTICKIGQEHCPELKRIVRRNKELQKNEKKAMPKIAPSKVDLNFRRNSPDADSGESNPDSDFVRSVKRLHKDVSDDYNSANEGRRNKGKRSGEKDSRNKDGRSARPSETSDNRRRRRDDNDEDGRSKSSRSDRKSSYRNETRVKIEGSSSGRRSPIRSRSRSRSISCSRSSVTTNRRRSRSKTPSSQDSSFGNRKRSRSRNTNGCKSKGRGKNLPRSYRTKRNDDYESIRSRSRRSTSTSTSDSDFDSDSD